MAKDLFFSKDARERLKRGVEALADAVQVTLGPRGRHVVIAQSWTSPKVTKDGVTVAQSVELTDPIENMGAEIVKEAASQTATSAGDGTTTATVLARALVCLGMRAIEEGANPVGLKRGMDAAVHIVVDFIRQKAIPVGEDMKEVENIATVSANNDGVIGGLIAEAMRHVTKNGIITVQDSKTMETSVTTVMGMHYDRGYLSPAFINKKEDMMVEYEDAFVLICEDKITNAQTILPILEKVMAHSRPLLIIADDFEGQALDVILLNRIRGQFPICAIKAPGYGDRRASIMEDIALATGGVIVGSKQAQTFKGLELHQLGQVKKFMVDHENTILVEGMGLEDKDKINERVRTIETLIANSTSEYDRDQNKQRLAKLSGGVAVINVGAKSEVEMREKKDRVEDALGATKAAVMEGIIPGGGVALARAAVKLGVLDADINTNGSLLKDLQSKGLSETELGRYILAMALLQPLLVIASNAGCDSKVILKKVLANKKFNFGYNAATDKFEDLMKSGVVDPAKVTRVALEHAVSVAGMILTTECVISPDKEDKKDRLVDQEMHSSFTGLG